MAPRFRKPLTLGAVAVAGASAALAAPALADGHTGGSGQASSSTASSVTPGDQVTAGDQAAPGGQGDTDRERPDDVRGPQGGPGGHHGHGPQGGPEREHRGGPSLDAAAETLGLTTDQLREKLGDQTLGEVADAAGVDRETLVDAMLADEKEHLTEMLDEQLPEPGEQGDHGEQGERGEQAPSAGDGETADDAATTAPAPDAAASAS